MESDLFAKLVLMPQKAVEARFAECFLDTINRDSLTEFHLQTLTHSTGFSLEKRERIPSLRRFSKAIASTNHWGFTSFRSFADYFGVSPIALGIRLEELKLIK